MAHGLAFHAGVAHAAHSRHLGLHNGPVPEEQRGLSRLPHPAGDAPSLVYTCSLPLSTQTLTFPAGLLRGHLKAIGSRWRKLPPGRIAVIVLAVLRLADIAGGNQISASTVRRWVLEVIDLLAARAPRLDRVLNKIAKQGGEVGLLDGPLVRTRRRTGTDNRKNYSGKHKVPGLLVLALTDRKGSLLWISAARPGRSSEITTARHNTICARLRDAGTGRHRRPRLRRTGRRPRAPGHHHRPQSRPRPSAHHGRETGQPAHQRRTRAG
ncbi:hypothetical protein [Microbispora hainanensis]|uniref:Transposase family protein n=1 Tax=Microbispora hainanensis TaxID=568844 RepID=A0ABZ1SJ04_9ACTN|nr:hypothetical protein [Microbispora hainanensis]